MEGISSSEATESLAAAKAVVAIAFDVEVDGLAEDRVLAVVIALSSLLEDPLLDSWDTWMRLQYLVGLLEDFLSDIECIVLIE